MYDHTHSLPVFLGLKSKGLARCVDQEIALSPWGLFPQLGFPGSRGWAAIVPLAACSPLCLPPSSLPCFLLLGSMQLYLQSLVPEKDGGMKSEQRMWGYPVYLVCRLRSGCDEREGDPGKAASGGFGACDGAPEVSSSCALTASSRPQWKPRRRWEGKDHITKARYGVPSVLLGQRLRHTTSWQTCVSVGFIQTAPRRAQRDRAAGLVFLRCPLALEWPGRNGCHAHTTQTD